MSDLAFVPATNSVRIFYYDERRGLHEVGEAETVVCEHCTFGDSGEFLGSLMAVWGLVLKPDVPNFAIRALHLNQGRAFGYPPRDKLELHRHHNLYVDRSHRAVASARMVWCGKEFDSKILAGRVRFKD